MFYKPHTERLLESLWGADEEDSDFEVFAILDGARDPKIAPLIRQSGLPYECLYRGQLSDPLQAAAPYLVHLEPYAELTQTLLESSWGASWGIFNVTPHNITLRDMQDHFRRLLRVKDKQGRKLVFRYYDPRVMRVYIPTCTTKEIQQLFGKVSRMVFEDEDSSTAIAYDWIKERLSRTYIPLPTKP